MKNVVNYTPKKMKRLSAGDSKPCQVFVAALPYCLNHGKWHQNLNPLLSKLASKVQTEEFSQIESHAQSVC